MRYHNILDNTKRELVALRIALQNVLANVLWDTRCANRVLRPLLVRSLGAKCGKAVMLRKAIYYGNFANIEIGDRTSVNREVFLDGFDKITLGSHVGIGFRVILNTSSHEMGPADGRVGNVMGSPIVVEDGVWIGAGAYIGPGVTLGRGCVVSAGAVVMRSVEPNVMVAGSPARVIKRLVDKEELPVYALKRCEAR
jgi:maltose O-acetyltransferase